MPNARVLERAGHCTMFTLLGQRRLRWLAHVRRMENGRMPKDILDGELASSKRTVGHHQLRFKDVCKRDTKALDINTESWEDAAADHSRWRSVLRKHLKSGEENILTTDNEKGARRKARIPRDIPACHTCSQCGRDCHSRIGLISHSCRCR